MDAAMYFEEDEEHHQEEDEVHFPNNETRSDGEEGSSDEPELACELEVTPPVSLLQRYDRLLERNYQAHRRSESLFNRLQQTRLSMLPRPDPIKEAEKQDQRDMDKFLNTKLKRDSCPPDTPLPIYLKYREPRCRSPPSIWDKMSPKKAPKTE
ncbi:uncharacterized protein Dwil_GK20773 [Drosophila willistoni]|uniref:Uncharacterized protein n=1 Tax=Drosophila willistoni TaxID=7260 RepID=B4MJP2_DROWI|nr:uncharacterized protein LOC6638150 [Drosophila willistoni]XP_046865500.1 uncharacterized protein LOC6638150 [Drosophila willistoni]EDW72331.1 uncharacterized protein Dwil_GK20773 [Drosophila willistoni]